MASNGEIWLGRVVIIVILAAAAFMLGTFIAQIENEKNKTQSPQDAAAKVKNYQRIGLSAGALIGIFWMLSVAGRDQKNKTLTTSEKAAINSVVAKTASTNPFATLATKP